MGTDSQPRTDGEATAGRTTAFVQDEYGSAAVLRRKRVQVARSFGAEVTGVCSTRNVELVGSLGATEVIDYTTTDVASRGDRYDVVFDLVGNRSLADLRGVLSPTGRLVLSGASDGRWLGPLPTLLRAAVIDRVASHRLAGFVSSVTAADLRVLAGLLESGELEPVVDRTYPFARVPAAIDYVERGHARGKVVVTV